jgi:hypothetical protein
VPDLPLPGHGAPAPASAPPLRVRGLARPRPCPRRARWRGPARPFAPVPARSPALARSPRSVPARPPLPARSRRRSPAARPSRRVPGAARPRFGAVGPRRGPATCAARSAPVRSAARAQLGPGVHVARSRRVLAWCARCFGTARRALGATRSVLSRVVCSSTPRRARLHLATCLPPRVFYA